MRQLGALGWQVSVARLGEHLRVAFRRLAAGGGLQALTARQLEVAQLYCQGATHKHIGARLAQRQVGFAEDAMPWLHAGVLLCIAALFLFLARRRLAAS